MLTGLFGAIAVLGFYSTPIIDPDFNYIPRHTVAISNLEFKFNYGGSSSFVDIDGKLGSSYVNIDLTYNVDVDKSFDINFPGVINFNSISAHIDVTTYYDGDYYGNDDVIDIYTWNQPFPVNTDNLQNGNYDALDILPRIYQHYSNDDPISFDGGITFKGNTYSINGGDMGSHYESYNILNSNGYPYVQNFKGALYEWFNSVTITGELMSEYGYTHGDDYQLGYDVGYDVGYDDGYHDGGGFSSALGAIYVVFARFTDIFNIEILPNVTLGLCFSIPFILILIISIFRIARG